MLKLKNITNFMLILPVCGILMLFHSSAVFDIRVLNYYKEIPIY